MISSRLPCGNDNGEILKAFVTSKLIEGLVLKPCHENNGAAIYVGRVATVHASIGQLLQLILKIYCGL